MLSLRSSNLKYHTRFRPSNIIKRDASRNVEYAYLQKGLENPAFKATFCNALPDYQSFPKLMDRYFRVSMAMRTKGMIPLVHAQSQESRMMQIFLSILCTGTSTNPNFFKYLRQPSLKYSICTEQVKSKLHEYIQQYGDDPYAEGVSSRPDCSPNLRTHLISGSYSIFDTCPQESAYSYLFNPKINIGLSAIYTEIIEAYLKRRNMQSASSNLLRSLKELSFKYNNLEISSLIAIGIPVDKIDIVYDSKAYGFPTNESVVQMINQPETNPRAYTWDQGGPQARLIIADDSLNPRSGIQVIDLGDDEEVDLYIKDVALEDPREVFKEHGIFFNSATKREEDHRTIQRLLDAEVKKLAFEQRQIALKC